MASSVAFLAPKNLPIKIGIAVAATPKAIVIPVGPINEPANPFNVCPNDAVPPLALASSFLYLEKSSITVGRLFDIAKNPT